MVYFFFFQAEDGIRDLVRSRGLGDVYKRQPAEGVVTLMFTLRLSFDKSTGSAPKFFIRTDMLWFALAHIGLSGSNKAVGPKSCLLYTSDAADERSSVDLGGRRIIKKKK